MTWMFFRRMKKYAFEVVSPAALKKLQNHNLNSEMGPLSLFSSCFSLVLSDQSEPDLAREAT